MESKILNNILWKIVFCLATLSHILANIPTISAVNTTETQISDQNTTNEATIHLLESKNSHEIQVSNEITENKSKNSLIIPTTTQLPSIEYDMNNRISGNSPVDQLTELSAEQIITPSVETKFENNDIVFDGIENTVSSVIMTADKNSRHQNKSNELRHQTIKTYGNQTISTQNNSRNSVPEVNSSLNMTTPELIVIPSEVAKRVNHDLSTQESHRYKRSFFRSSLHSNLDELLNMKRRRRSSIRSKRNTNYEDLLATLLAAEEAKYDDNYNLESFVDKNELNALAMNYILSALNSGNSDNKNIDLDKLSQYYYDNLLPLIETIDSDSESASNEESINQELPIIVQPYSQSVIPVVPYSVPNRYQRIRRSYYDRYRNPISVYTGLKKKRGQHRGEWGRIVGANSDRSTYDDEAQEANKIYSLATLLATDTSADENRLRYKRSARRLFKPITTLKNM